MNMFMKDGVEYLTTTDIAAELGLTASTVYSRLYFKSAPTRWRVEIVQDPGDKREKYVVSRENFEKIWRPYKNQAKKSESQRKRFIKSKTTKK